MKHTKKELREFAKWLSYGIDCVVEENEDELYILWDDNLTCISNDLTVVEYDAEAARMEWLEDADIPFEDIEKWDIDEIIKECGAADLTYTKHIKWRGDFKEEYETYRKEVEKLAI
jgi:hypothetical protein